MKGIVVTKENFNDVYGKIIKFFLPNGKNKTSAMAFDVWGSTKIRRRNHIRVDGHVSHVFVQKVLGYLDENQDPVAIGIHVTDILQGDCVMYITVGTKIAFCGNRIVFKAVSVDDVGNRFNVYMAVQVSNVITEKELQEIRMSAPVEINPVTTLDVVDENGSNDNTNDHCECGCDHTCS